MTYSSALDIARRLADADTAPAKLLREKCRLTGRKATFVIMRYGDPHDWTKVPKKCDNRVTRKHHHVPGVLKVASLTKARAKRVVQAVRREGGIAVALMEKHGAKLKKRCRYRDGVITVVMYRGDPRQWSETLYRLAHPGRKIRDWRRIVHSRPVRLQHIDTGRIITAKSIVAFVERHLPEVDHARFHVTPVLDGERSSYKGWYLPETLARKVTLRDVYGNLLSFRVRDAKQHGFTPRMICSLLKGATRATKTNRVALADVPLSKTPFSATKRPKITSVTLVKGDRVVTASSLPKVAREAGIYTSIANLYEMAYGLRDEVRGFRLKQLKTEPRRVFAQP